MGVFVRSDSIAHLTPAGREALTAYGVTTVIDLRTDGEVSRVPNPFADGAGPAYRHLPMIDDSMMVELGAASVRRFSTASPARIAPAWWRLCSCPSPA